MENVHIGASPDSGTKCVEVSEIRDPKNHISIGILQGYPYLTALLGFIIREFIWDIPILIFAYVPFLGALREGRVGACKVSRDAKTLSLRNTVEARKLEHQYPHALKVEYRGS